MVNAINNTFYDYTQTDDVIHTTPFYDRVGESKPYSFAEILWVYLAPLILVTGLTGNILILIIMKRRKFRGTTTSVYLRMMALADSSFLLTGQCGFE